MSACVVAVFYPQCSFLIAEGLLGEYAGEISALLPLSAGEEEALVAGADSSMSEDLSGAESAGGRAVVADGGRHPCPVPSWDPCCGGLEPSGGLWS